MMYQEELRAEMAKYKSPAKMLVNATIPQPQPPQPQSLRPPVPGMQPPPGPGMPPQAMNLPPRMPPQPYGLRLALF